MLPISRAVSVVVLAFGDEPFLPECLDALSASTGVEIELIIVDNGCKRGDLAQLATSANAKLVTAPNNLGFTGGCNLGAQSATTSLLVLLNSDAIVQPEALANLVDALDDPEVGIASASLRLAANPERMNSAGNPYQYLGVTWAGGLDDAATGHQTAGDVAIATGAACALRTQQWRELGGLADWMFAYHEDAELSIRTWLAGRRVRYVPNAVVHHHYEFSRTANKWYLLERNRLGMLFTVFTARTLLVLAPMLLLFEIALLLFAAREGWARQKLGGWLWLARNRRRLAARRQVVQATRTAPDSAFLRHAVARIEPAVMGDGALLRFANTFFATYWQLIRQSLVD